MAQFSRLVSPLALLGLLSLHAPAQDQADQDWRRFRGSDANSIQAQRAYPGDWGPETNVAWAAELGGSGWSSPIVVGERVFVSSAVHPDGDGPVGMATGVRDPSTMGRGPKPDKELRFQLACLALEDGSTLWTREVGKAIPAHGVHRSNTFATESPCSDGERVFVTFGALGRLAAFDLQGEALWSVDTGFYSTGNNFGWGISVVAGDGLVFLQNDNEESSFLAAFDAESGTEAWRVERGNGTSWGTPVLLADEERRSLLATGPDSLVAYDPKSGQEQWRVQGFGGSFSSSLSYDAERVYFGNSGPMSRGPLLAVPRSAKGLLDLKAEEPAAISWKTDRAGPGFASPLVHDGLIYIVASTNILTCHDAATGKQVYKERLPDLATVVASPWAAGDELFVMDEAGLTNVVRLGRDFEILRSNDLPGLFWATPAVAGDALLLRDAGKLYCIRD